MATLDTVISSAGSLRDPVNYYHGLQVPSRWRVQNLLLFLRHTADTLQQKNFSNQLHFRHVLLFVLETPGILHLDGEALRLVPGEAILIHPYQFHHYSGLEAADLKWLFLTFEIESGSSGLEGLRHRVVEVGEPGLDLIERVIAEYARDDSSPEVHLPLVDSLLGELNRTEGGGSRLTASGRSKANSWFSMIEPKLRQGLDSGLSLAGIARKIGMSERNLRQRFKAEAGITLRDYRINHQLHRAVSLMRRPEASLKVIAELSGFHSAQSFSRFFRTATGMSAREYRKRAFSD